MTDTIHETERRLDAIYRRLEVDRYLDYINARRIKVVDLEAAMEAQRWGRACMPYLTAKAISRRLASELDGEREVRRCATHAAHYARRALDLTEGA